MIQPVPIKVTLDEYQILRYYTRKCDEYVKSHISFNKSAGVPIETILASVYSRYFTKLPGDVTIPRKGKKVDLEYYEAKALYDYLQTQSFEVTPVLSKLDKALTDWKPSVSAQSFKSWYNDNDVLKDTFGEFDDLNDFTLEISQQLYDDRNDKVQTR